VAVQRLHNIDKNIGGYKLYMGDISFFQLFLDAFLHATQTTAYFKTFVCIVA